MDEVVIKCLRYVALLEPTRCNVIDRRREDRHGELKREKERGEK
jgi:hypothetical protein